MSDVSTLATAKDIPNDVLITGLTNPAPTIPAPSGAPVVPQNVVPSQPSFIASIIGDKYVPIRNHQSSTNPLTGMNSKTLCVAPTSRLVSVLWCASPLPFLAARELIPDVLGPWSRAYRSTSSLDLRFDRSTSSDARIT